MPKKTISKRKIAKRKKLQKEKAFDNKELVLKKDLSAEEIARFNVRSFNFQHAFIAQRYRRISDYPEIFSHVLGYTARIENDIKSLKDINKYVKSCYNNRYHRPGWIVFG